MGQALLLAEISRILNIPFVSDKIKDGNHICYSIALAAIPTTEWEFKGSTLLSKMFSLRQKKELIWIDLEKRQENKYRITYLNGFLDS